MNPYVLGLDVWEGSLDIDETTLKAGGVEFLIIRLNDMNGYNHPDENFTRQWEQAENFIRWPYYVYSPWYSGKDNFDWMMAHLPAGCNHIAVDVEVRRTNYSPISYYVQVMDFCYRLGSVMGYEIYTGQWFLDVLAAWPNCNYWWARYPYAYYPASRECWTFEKLHAQIAATAWVPGRTPGPCKLWQISGDRIILPGCANRPVDVNVWNGTLEELKIYAGESLPELNYKTFLPGVKS